MTRPLSARETEVARLVADGLTDDEIAAILRLSARTVQSYLDRIGKKLGAGEIDQRRRRVIRDWYREQHTAA